MSEPAAGCEDRFSAVWPVLAFVLGAISEVLASAGKFDALVQLSLVPIILFGFVASIVWFIATMYNVCRCRWRRVMSALAAVPAALLTMPGLWSSFDLASEVRLIANYGEYDRQIAALSDPVGKRRTSWYWGGNTTAMTGGELYRLVYDETAPSHTVLCSGESQPPVDRRWCGPDGSEPTAWWLWGHFYLIEETVR